MVDPLLVIQVVGERAATVVPRKEGHPGPTWTVRRRRAPVGPFRLSCRGPRRVAGSFAARDSSMDELRHGEGGSDGREDYRRRSRCWAADEEGLGQVGRIGSGSFVDGSVVCISWFFLTFVAGCR
jgi:hypothetical protein